MSECHLSVMSQQTTTATNRASVMHAVIHAWYMSGLISRSVYIGIYWSYTVLILRRSGMELLMGKFHQIFTELSARDTPIFSFPDDNLSK